MQISFVIRNAEFSAIESSLARPDVPGKGTSGHYCQHSVDDAGMLAYPQIDHLRVKEA